MMTSLSINEYHIVMMAFKLYDTILSTLIMSSFKQYDTYIKCINT